MTNKLTSPEMRLPPPSEFVLWHGDEKVGWTRGRRIGFTGFANAGTAAAAAWIADAALARRRDRSDGAHAPLTEMPPLSMKLHHDGDEWIWAGDRVLARLIRPGVPTLSTEADDPTGVGNEWWSIEIQLPSFADDLAVASAAHVVHRTLRRVRLPWAALDPVAPIPDAPSEARSPVIDVAAMANRLRGWWRRVRDVAIRFGRRNAERFPEFDREQSWG